MKEKITSQEPVREELENPKPSSHPSRSLVSRSKGYGIGGGYERPYRKVPSPATKRPRQAYGPIPHSGYYGAGAGAERFERGQAGFRNELRWYGAQYGETTIGRTKEQS